MVQTKTLEIQGIGTVLFEKSARAKYLNISVKPFIGVRVAVPHRMSFTTAQQTVDAKIPWIRKQLPKMEQLEKELRAIGAIEDRMDRTDAGKLLVARLNELSHLHGLPYNRVSIRNQKTRWGSCSSKNNINLNRMLFLLPAELRDYIILHELTHTKIKSHRSEFYAALGKLAGNVKVLRSRLNTYKSILVPLRST